MRGIGVVLWFILLLSAVTAADKFPEYPVRSASQYSSCQTKNGISAAVEQVGDKDTQKKYFGTSLGSQGILPVLVVLENASESGSLLLQRELVTYRIGEDQAKNTSGGPESVRSKSGEGLAIASMGGPLLMFIGLKMIAGASEVKQNILVKELRSQTLAPGKASNGFLYVPLGKPGSEKRRVSLSIPLSLDDKQEAQLFTFNLEIPGSENKK